MTCGRWIIPIGLVACAGDADPDKAGGTGATGDTDATLAIAGSYTDEFGTEHVIDEASWAQTYPGYGSSTWTVASWDDEEMVVIAQNPSDAAYYPGLWSRFDWVGDLHYCQTAFAAASEAEAEATPRADDADLDGGCGGFAWTDLTP